jgi:N-acetylglutamate synthase-like GNAT family acetyltransferase
MGMTIEFLVDHPEAFSTLAQWQHAEWGHTRPGDTAEARRARIESWCNRDGIPLAVVALEDGEVLGSASLIAYDMETRMELTPWLAAVFVGEQYRRKGIGAALVRRIMDEAGRLDIPLLYLYTVHSEKFYAALGWTLLEHSGYREQKVAIMTYVPTQLEP